MCSALTREYADRISNLESKISKKVKKKLITEREILKTAKALLARAFISVFGFG